MTTALLQGIGWIAGLGLVSVICLLMRVNTSNHSSRSQARAYQESQMAKIEGFREVSAARSGITPKRNGHSSAPIHAEGSVPSDVPSARVETDTHGMDIIPEIWEAALKEADTVIKMITHTEAGNTVNVCGRVGLFAEGPKGGLILELGDETLANTVPVFVPQSVIDKCGVPAWGQPITVKGIVREGKRRGLVANYWHEPITQVA